MGAMTMETAAACIPAENMRPDDPVWLHHTNSCQNHTLLDRMKRQYFGDGEHSPQQYILRSQAIQSEITRHIYEEFRRQKFTCSGLLFWTLSDSYGVHNWSLIDYALRRKPIYHALKQAMAPLALCIRGWDVHTDEGRTQWREHWQQEPGKLEIWGMNDTRLPENVRVEWTLMTVDGQVLRQGEKAVMLPANGSVRLLDASLEGICFDPARTVFRARLYAGGTLANETRYFFAPFDEMAKQQAEVQISCRSVAENTCEVSLTADRFLWMAHLAEPGDVRCGENDFELWPGETRRVIVTGTAADYRPELHWMGKEN
jgi:beta-mannosidase